MSNCENRNENNELCPNNAAQSEKKLPETIPYIAHEAAMDRAERREKRNIIALIVAISLLFVSNALWLWAWMQYDYESYSLSAEGNGNANYIGNDGDIYNGESGSEEENPQNQENEG